MSDLSQLPLAVGHMIGLGALALLFPVGRLLWRQGPSGRHPSE